MRRAKGDFALAQSKDGREETEPPCAKAEKLNTSKSATALATLRVVIMMSSRAWQNSIVSRFASRLGLVALRQTFAIRSQNCVGHGLRGCALMNWRGCLFADIRPGHRANSAGAVFLLRCAQRTFTV
jgi:hypothetical protein